MPRQPDRAAEWVRERERGDVAVVGRHLPAVQFLALVLLHVITKERAQITGNSSLSNYESVDE